MNCKYCNEELPKVINSQRDVCGCEKAQTEWRLKLEINHLKKELSIYNKELRELDDALVENHEDHSPQTKPEKNSAGEDSSLSNSLSCNSGTDLPVRDKTGDTSVKFGCGKKGMYEGMNFHCNGILLCEECRSREQSETK